MQSYNCLLKTVNLHACKSVGMFLAYPLVKFHVPRSSGLYVIITIPTARQNVYIFIRGGQINCSKKCLLFFLTFYRKKIQDLKWVMLGLSPSYK